MIYPPVQGEPISAAGWPTEITEAVNSIQQALASDAGPGTVRDWLASIPAPDFNSGPGVIMYWGSAGSWPATWTILAPPPTASSSSTFALTAHGGVLTWTLIKPC